MSREIEDELNWMFSKTEEVFKNKSIEDYIERSTKININDISDTDSDLLFSSILFFSANGDRATKKANVVMGFSFLCVLFVFYLAFSGFVVYAFSMLSVGFLLDLVRGRLEDMAKSFGMLQFGCAYKLHRLVKNQGVGSSQVGAEPTP